MLLNIITQYVLFVICNLSALYDTAHATSIETHVFNSSVTLLIAIGYYAVAYAFYSVFVFLTHTTSSWNPDLDRYDHVLDSVAAEQRGSAGSCSPACRGRKRPSHAGRAAGRGGQLRQLRAQAASLQGESIEDGETLEQRAAGSTTGSESVLLPPQRAQKAAAPGPGAAAEAADAGGARVDDAKAGAGGDAGDSVRESALRMLAENAQAVNAAAMQEISSQAGRSSKDKAGAAGLIFGSGHAGTVYEESLAGEQVRIVFPDEDEEEMAALHGKHEQQPSLMQFYLNVYGFGIVIFVVYYAMDMVMLAPALAFMTGLIILSFRDVYDLFSGRMMHEDIVLSRSLTLLSLLLTLIALAEMLTTMMEVEDDSEWSRAGASSAAFTYVLPYVVCMLIACIPRSCSSSRAIAQAMPTAAFIAAGIVLMVLSADSVMEHYEDTVHGIFERTFEFGMSGAVASETDGGGDAGGAAMMPINTLSGEQPFESFESARPVGGRISLVMILVTPLFKLALTFSVITCAINRKTMEVVSFLTFLTAVKELHMQSAPGAVEHVTRAAVISGAATIFSLVRYVRPVFTYLLSH